MKRINPRGVNLKNPRITSNAEQDSEDRLLLYRCPFAFAEQK